MKEQRKYTLENWKDTQQFFLKLDIKLNINEIKFNRKEGEITSIEITME